MQLDPRVLAATISAVCALLGALIGVIITQWLLGRRQKKEFSDKDKRDQEALINARYQALAIPVADYLEAATRHVDLCRQMGRMKASQAANNQSNGKTEGNELNELTTKLYESNSKLRSLAVRLTALSTHEGLQQEVRDVLRLAWNERREALGESRNSPREPAGLDAVKAMRWAVWSVILELRKETGIGEKGLIDQDYFVNGKPRPENENANGQQSAHVEESVAIVPIP
jgi:hypothetical protein